MYKKEMIAMLLAGGQGSRLGVLTRKVAKPAVAYGGRYRIIDFPLSNCINSGIDSAHGIHSIHQDRKAYKDRSHVLFLLAFCKHDQNHADQCQYR